MVIEIGLFSYLLVASCKQGLGEVAYPLQDTDITPRQLVICTDESPEQTKQVLYHETLHACMHAYDVHKFYNKVDLKHHLDTWSPISFSSGEEAFVSAAASCLLGVVENKDVLHFYGLSESSDGRSSGR